MGSSARSRLALAGVIAASMVTGALLLPASGAEDHRGNLLGTHSRDAAAQKIAAQGTLALPNGEHAHVDGARVRDGKVTYDPVVKNAVSRDVQGAKANPDPTSAQEKAANRDAAQSQTDSAEPALTHVPLAKPSTATVPPTKYAMFDGCYALQDPATGRWLGAGAAPTFLATSKAQATPFFFKASDLGRYLLRAPDGRLLAGSGARTAYAAKPGPSADWAVERPTAGRFTFTLAAGRSLTANPDGSTAVTTAATQVALRLTTGCTPFPEIGTQVTGDPIAGATPYQETRGFIDAHTHGMAFEFLGGDVHCGRPWSPYGVEVALVDCPDHQVADGKGAILEGFLSGDLDGHDPVGWPTFKDWPAPHSLTHEGTYYKWMERSWRSGQRVLVNLLVENNKLCELYPIKRNPCNDMKSIRLQAADMHKLERYVDAQSGGPGKGWYRIVTSPEQARTVINQGKLAVVMGIETSIPFGCTTKLGIPACTAASIDRQLDEMKALGVSQMELVNKFDNALSGVAGDEGSTGALVNTANFLETGSFWRMQTCDPQDPQVHDKDQTLLPELPAQDALFGAIVKLNAPLAPLPVYPKPHHCNAAGLTDLGEHLIRGMAQRNMIFDPDHMSVKARKRAMDVVESMGYPAVISSHSWSTPDAYPRILDDKGFITPYAGDSSGFVAKWQQVKGWANPATYWGIGFGADINGLGAQGEPRANAASNPVTYPFTTLGGVSVDKQVSGQRVYDINKDGVSHYGLYPDWIEDLRKQAGNDIVTDLARGPEAYLQMWERAYGIASNACATTSGRRTPAFFSALPVGSTTWQVLKRAGQPDRRLGNTFSYCSTDGNVSVRFTANGRLEKVTAG